MGRNLFFTAGQKSFEIRELSDDWYEVVERCNNFISRVSLDRYNLKEICRCMKEASEVKGKVCKSWKYQRQLYAYHIYLNFNNMGRFIRLVAAKGKSNSTIIIPEFGDNVG